MLCRDHFGQLLLISKIPHFESNSQPFVKTKPTPQCCYWYQRYLILKAIHNIRSSSSSDNLLLLISKIPHFESNSQPLRASFLLKNSCYWYQRYLILKAIHNTGLTLKMRRLVVTDIKDTSFWKQFTTNQTQTKRWGVVVTDIKDTSFWKQFTTITETTYLEWVLLLISKIPHFESNSQRKSWGE